MRFLAVLLLLFHTLPALAAGRHALVVGNDLYVNLAPLDSARNDAQAVAAALEQAEFDVALVEDAGRLAFLEALGLLTARVAPGDEVLVYYAGHGVQIDGRNLLIPVDTPALEPGQETVLRHQAIEVADLLDELKGTGAASVVLILDACRNNPFPRAGTRSLGGTRGLIAAPPPQGVFLLYSADEGEMALDRLGKDDRDPNSVFTRVLLRHMTEPGMTMQRLAKLVQQEVHDLAAGVSHPQFPAYYDRMLGDAVLVAEAGTSHGSGAADGAGDPPPAPPAAPARGGGSEDCAAAQTAWMALKGANPSRTALEAFRHSHPGCPQVLAEVDALARSRAAATLAECTALADPSRLTFEALRGGDPAKAEAACRRALGWSPRSPRLAFLLGRALFAQDKDAEAVAQFAAAARGGDTDAMNNLGVAYEYGYGVPADPGAAVGRYRAAAEGGSAMGLHNLAVLTEDGTGVPKDFAEALRLYRAAADLGSRDAAHRLGQIHDFGLGLPEDDAAAARWYRAAAEAGHVVAMFDLGVLYGRGDGVAHDEALAVRWYRAAAGAGHAEAMYYLGVRLSEGRGVGEDDRLAADWLLRAAAAGAGVPAVPDAGAVAELQRRLTESGDYDGPLSGFYTPETRAALAAYGARQ